VDTAGAIVDTPPRRGVFAPAGVGEHGIGASGLPGNLGDPATPSRYTLAWGLPNRKAPGPKPASGLCGATKTGARDGTAKRTKRKCGRTVRRVSERLIVPEAGEREPRGPWGGKGTPHRGAVGSSQRQDSEPGHAVNGKLTDSVAACKTTMRRAGCLNWARPDLREQWGATPTATRPGTWCPRNPMAHYPKFPTP
jgi:hypothetical protein